MKNNIKNIKTFFRFPILKFDVEYKYSKLVKPSGISFMLLVIFEKFYETNKKISDLLTEFNISKDLHNIFAEEISFLIEKEIIKTKNYLPYEQNYFNEYPIEYFEFTKKGKEVFENEKMPFNNYDYDRKEIFYNFALDNFTGNSPEYDTSYVPWQDEEGLLMDPKVNKNNKQGIEDFLNTKKGTNEIKANKNDILYNVTIFEETKSYVNLSCPLDLNLNLSNYKMDFNFNNKKYLDFFIKKFYNFLKSDNLKQFPYIINNDFVYDYALIQSNNKDDLIINDLHLIKEMSKLYEQDSAIIVISQEYKFALREKEINKSTIIFHDDDNLFKYFEYKGFIKFFKKNDVRIYYQTFITFDNDALGEIRLPFLIERNVSEFINNQIINDIFAKFTNLEIDNDHKFNFDKLIKLTEFFECFDKLIMKINTWFTVSLSHNIKILELIHKQYNGSKSIFVEFLKEKSMDFFYQIFKDISLSNFKNKIKSIEWIKDLYKTNDWEILERLFNIEDIKNNYNKIELFDILVHEIKMDTKFVLTFMKEIPNLLFENNSSTSDLGNDINSFLNCLTELKRITNVDDLNNKNYLLEERDYDDFQKNCNFFEDFLKKFNFLKEFCENKFEEFEKFQTFFNDVNLQFIKKFDKPENMNLEIIKKFLKKDFRKWIINLYIKFEDICRNKFLLTNNDKKIEYLFQNKIINKDENELLHKLRTSRNSAAHASHSLQKINDQNLDKILNIIFNKLDKYREKE